MADWTVNNLPDSSFLMIKPGGTKDSDGKTTSRDLRLFPYRDAKGMVDLPHLRDAIARIPQAPGLSADQKKALQSKARSILAKSGQKQMSMFDMINSVSQAVRDASPYGQQQAMSSGMGDSMPEYWYVEDVYPGYAIIDCGDCDYKVSYSMDDAGNVSLAPRAQWVQVEEQWVEVSVS